MSSPTLRPRQRPRRETRGTTSRPAPIPAAAPAPVPAAPTLDERSWGGERAAVLSRLAATEARIAFLEAELERSRQRRS